MELVDVLHERKEHRRWQPNTKVYDRKTGKEYRYCGLSSTRPSKGYIIDDNAEYLDRKIILECMYDYTVVKPPFVPTVLFKKSYWHPANIKRWYLFMLIFSVIIFAVGSLNSNFTIRLFASIQWAASVFGVNYQAMKRWPKNIPIRIRLMPLICYILMLIIMITALIVFKLHK